MRKIISLYRLLNILSLDVVIGAVICALFFARLFYVKLLPYGLAALALTVWIIYTADHLKDAKSIAGAASSERHRFHQKNFMVLFSCMLFAIVADAIVIFFMRKPVLSWGLVLLAVVIVYLVVQHHLKVFKELFIACLYTCGILIPSIAVIRNPINECQWILIFQFFLVALINLLVFSWFDNESDDADKLHSFVTNAGKKVASLCIYSFAFINLLLTVWLLMLEFDYKAILILSLMNILQLVIFSFRDFFQHGYHYRLLGDATFFLPVIYLWFRH